VGRLVLRTPHLVGLALVSGALLAMSYALQPIWWAAWLAPAPVVAATLLARGRLRDVLGLLTGAIADAGTFAYHVDFAGWATAMVVLVLVSVGWWAALRLTARLAEKDSASLAALAVPVTWAAVDTLLIYVSPHGSAGSIAYSQIDFLPVVQLASIGGVPLVTFTLLLPGSLAGVALARRLGARPLRLHLAAGVTALVVGGGLLFGAVRLSGEPADGGRLVALVGVDRVAEKPRDWDGFWRIYGPATEAAARRSSLVLLPEALATFDPKRAERARIAMSHFARSQGVTAAAGCIVRNERGVTTNRTLLAYPDGGHAWYAKHHLVPGIESGRTAGDRMVLWGTGPSRTGVAICKDMHFPTLGRAYADAGARLMLVSAYDMIVDGRWAAGMTAFRGVEGGYSIARSTRKGISFVSDPYGRMVAQQASGPAMQTLVAAAPPGLESPTIYARIGNFFGWLCVAAWGALVLAGRVWGRATRSPFGGPSLRLKRA
jgi:apolipoprotein N-acyltransferase